MTTYSITIGRKRYRKLKGHLIHYEKGFVELTREDEQVSIVPIRNKVVVLDPKWLLNKKEHLQKQSLGQAKLD